MNVMKRFEGKRFAQAVGGPRTLDIEARSVDAVLSKGSAVQRSYGIERLQISKAAVDLSRLQSTGIAVLDSHEQRGIANALGRLTSVWIEGGSLIGRIRFNQTVEGERALQMIARGEVTAVSVGYQVSRWQVTDENGQALDPSKGDRIPFDGSATFTATRWGLLECSLVSVPADADAVIRSFPGSSFDHIAIRDVRARMQARQRMVERLQPRQRSRSAFYGHSGNLHFK